MVTAEVDCLTMLFGVDRVCFVHGHSTDRVLGRNFRFLHGHEPQLVLLLSLERGLHSTVSQSEFVVPILYQNNHFLSFKSRALMATITVLADINTAPRAGLRSTPHA